MQSYVDVEGKRVGVGISEVSILHIDRSDEGNKRHPMGTKHVPVNKGLHPSWIPYEVIFTLLELDFASNSPLPRCPVRVR